MAYGNEDGWLMHEPGEWENEEGPLDWYAVSNTDGIKAYFGDEVDALLFLKLKEEAEKGKAA